MVKFLRRSCDRYSKLGKKRKNKQIWRKPTGRDNKMREKRRGYPVVVSIGYRGAKIKRGKTELKTPILVKNLNDLEKIKTNQIAIIGNIGKKKKLEIAKKAKEMKIKLSNMNQEKFLKLNTKKADKQKKSDADKKKNESKK